MENQIDTVQEDSTNLNIQMRNKMATHIMRVEMPEGITREICETRGVMFLPSNEDIYRNLENILHMIAKSYLKHNFDIDKEPITDFNLYENNTFQNWSDQAVMVPLKLVDPLYTMRMFFDDEGETVLKWGDKIDDHPLRPATEETVKSEKGVMFIYPSYVKLVSQEGVKNYLEVNGK